MSPRRGHSELTFDADDFELARRGVPCPVEWCDAHVLRYAVCGDPSGHFYGGVHVARVNRAKNGRWATKKQRELERAGLSCSPAAVALAQSLEDGQNLGLLQGETDAMRRQARARSEMK